VALAAAGLWYVGLREPRNVAVVTETTSVPPATAARQPAEPGEDIELPPLGESDALVRELLSRLSSHPRVAAWLATDGLIRNFTVVVTNVANGRSPSGHLKPLIPDGRFQARKDGDRVWIDTRSYSRYDGHADAVASIDARGAARLYATLKPRIEEANKELGTTEPFDVIVQRAIVELLETPIVDEDVRLIDDSVSYKFADPSLESLSAVQRQFLRMGARNVRIVSAKLRETAGHIGIPAGSLPPERRAGSDD
jgi:hypothetical protein